MTDNGGANPSPLKVDASTGLYGCLFQLSDSATFSRESKEALWGKLITQAP
jgi:hypothetical protein